MCSTTTLPSVLHSFPYNRNNAILNQALRLPSSGLCQNLPNICGFADEPARWGGLRTPPSDDMSTTYHPAQLSNYDNHVVPAYASGLGQAGRAKAALTEAARQSQYSRYPTPIHQHSQHSHAISHSQQQHSHPLSQSTTQSQARAHPSSGSSQHASASRHSTRPSTPTSTGTLMGSHQDGSLSRRGSQAVALPGLQIPASISPNGGSISDLAAQVRKPPCRPNFSKGTKTNQRIDDVPLLVRVDRCSSSS